MGRLVRTVFLRNRRAGPWPVPERLACEEVRFTGNSGARVVGRWFPAEKSERPRGVVVLAHPDRRYGKHWFVREGWIDFLRERGFASLAFDFPGYGESRGGATYFPEDVAAAARFARDRGGGAPVHVVGLSMGAFAAANASPHLDFVSGLVLESPYPTFNAWYGRGFWKLAMGAFDALFPASSALIQATHNLPRARVRRVLVVAPLEDRVTAPALTREVAAAGPAGRTRLLEIPGAGHLEPFSTSARYREALLETLGWDGSGPPGGTVAAERSPVVAGSTI